MKRLYNTVLKVTVATHIVHNLTIQEPACSVHDWTAFVTNITMSYITVTLQAVKS